MFTLTVAQLLKRHFFRFFSPLALSLLNNVLFTHALTNHVHVFKTCGVVQMSLLFPILYVAFSSEVLICPFWCKKIEKKTKTNQHQLPDKKCILPVCPVLHTVDLFGP